MIERGLTLIVIVLVMLAAYAVMRRWQMHRAVELAQTDPLLTGVRAGVPVIVYFTSPQCAPCQYQQKPALASLQADLGEAVQVVEINALEQPDAARRWGVLSVPTTFVLDSQGQPRDINHGVAGTDKLKQQLQRVA